MHELHEYEIIDGLTVVTDVELMDTRTALRLVINELQERKQDKLRRKIIHRRKVKTMISKKLVRIAQAGILLIAPALVSFLLFPDCTPLLLYFVFVPMAFGHVVKTKE